MIPECECCWCCKYMHGPECDYLCDDMERECECREQEYRPMIEGLIGEL